MFGALLPQAACSRSHCPCPLSVPLLEGPLLKMHRRRANSIRDSAWRSWCSARTGVVGRCANHGRCYLVRSRFNNQAASSYIYSQTWPPGRLCVRVCVLFETVRSSWSLGSLVAKGHAVRGAVGHRTAMTISVSQVRWSRQYILRKPVAS